MKRTRTELCPLYFKKLYLHYGTLPDLSLFFVFGLWDSFTRDTGDGGN